MSNPPAIDPEMAPLAAALSDPSMPSIENQSPEEVRAVLVALRPSEKPELFAVRDLFVEREGADAILLRLYQPTADPLATILFFHGGGWVVGSIEDYDYFTRRLALATGCTVISVEYRLAPENPFPAAVEDAWDAFVAMTAEHGPLFVAGDSAGGNLAAVVAQRAMDEGKRQPSGQLLFYPSVAGDIDAPSFNAFVPPVLPRPQIAGFFNHYIPDHRDREDVRFAPARAQRLSGLAPALVVTAEVDLLAAEGEDYATKMAAAGVDVQIYRQPGAIHGYLTLGPDLAASQTTLTAAHDFIARHAGSGRSLG